MWPIQVVGMAPDLRAMRKVLHTLGRRHSGLWGRMEHVYCWTIVAGVAWEGSLELGLGTLTNLRTF